MLVDEYVADYNRQPSSFLTIILFTFIIQIKTNLFVKYLKENICELERESITV